MLFVWNWFTLSSRLLFLSLLISSQFCLYSSFECCGTVQEVLGMDFHITQPGSSVATSLIDGESKPKHVLLLEVKVRGGSGLIPQQDLYVQVSGYFGPT